MSKITRLEALEILDSRGRPTVEVTCHLQGGFAAAAQVPSGASTGTAEALEVRDHDARRHGGWGCLRAVANVLGEIQAAVTASEFDSLAELDAALVRLDGTPNKSRLGANALLATSLAFARAQAGERGLPLYLYFAQLGGITPVTLPRPTVNLFSGGRHAGGQVAIQDVLIVPLAATSMAQALAHVCAVFQAAVAGVGRKYRSRALVADEGGLAPEFPHAEAMLEDAMAAITEAGLTPGTEVALAVDVASTQFHRDGHYELDGRRLDSEGMIACLESWVRRYPIVSIEDGLAEEDWVYWPKLFQRISGHTLVLGDDLLCTHPARIRRAIAAQAANALLLKVNQIGTVSEALESNRIARGAGWSVTVSARSGETEDHWLADLATGWQGTHIKIGSITRSERLAKYNRLLAIESATGWPLTSPDPARGSA